MKNTFLFVTDTYYKEGKLTGAHKRFLELVRGISKIANVILITRDIPQLKDIEAERYLIGEKRRRIIPAHINGMMDLAHTLIKIKNKLSYDYAISFGPTNTICLKWCGYKHIISLFREDLIGYQEVLNASKIKLRYSQWIEKTALLGSDKVLVQCKNDRNNLIMRNMKYDSKIDKKVFIQVNNANASWMHTDCIEHNEILDGKIRILFIGDFSDKRKGHNVVLPAIARLLDDGYKIEFLVAGDGKELDQYKNLYKKYDEIKFMGRVENISYYLSISDFEVVPSLIDSCPNTVLEGLNAGIAVYGANTGGIPDLLSEDRFLFEPNSDSIYSFLKNVIENSCYIEDAASQKAAKDRLTFDWVLAVKKIIESSN